MGYIYRMITERDLLSVLDAYSDAHGLADATISYRIFNDGKKISQLRNGGTITVARLNETLQFLSSNWPRGARWPRGVKRPPANSPAGG